MLPATAAKPNKEHSRISGYRMTTTQNSVGKLLEKTVGHKFASNLEKHLMFPSAPGPCRSNKETWSSVAIFAQDVFEGKEACAPAMVIEDAYNKASFNYLMCMILRLDCTVSSSGG